MSRRLRIQPTKIILLTAIGGLLIYLAVSQGTIEPRQAAAADTAAAHTLLTGAGGALGALSDRALAALPAGSEALAVDGEGNVHLCPKLLTQSDDPSLEPVLQLAQELSLDGTERSLVASAFVAAHRGSAAERRRLASELQDG